MLEKDLFMEQRWTLGLQVQIEKSYLNRVENTGMRLGTGNRKYVVQVIGSSERVTMALARMWATAVIRRSMAIAKPGISDPRKGEFECEKGHASYVVRSKKVQGAQKARRIDTITKRIS